MKQANLHANERGLCLYLSGLLLETRDQISVKITDKNVLIVLAVYVTVDHGRKLLPLEHFSEGTLIFSGTATAGDRERAAPVPSAVVALKYFDTA